MRDIGKLTTNTSKATLKSLRYSMELNARISENNVNDGSKEDMSRVTNNCNVFSTQPVLVTEQKPKYPLSVGNSDTDYLTSNPDESLKANVDFNVSADQLKDIDPVTIYSKDNDGDTMLHTAIILQKTKECLLFISMAPTHRWLSFQNLLFQTPLHLAAMTNQPEIIRRLLVAGADVTSQDKDGNTALHIACRDGRLDVVISLLEPVRYSETKQNKYDIPFQSIPQDYRMVNYDGLTCLHLAAINGNIDIIEVLVKNDIDINMKEGKSGRTVLHYACLKGDINLVKLLLLNRACDINARALDGCTPFDLARSSSHSNICLTLAAAGARYGDDNLDAD